MKKCLMLIAAATVVHIAVAGTGAQGAGADRKEIVSGVTYRYGVYTNDLQEVAILGWNNYTNSGRYHSNVGPFTGVSSKNALNGKVVLPNRLGGFRVRSIGVECFSECTSLTSVVIPEGVEEILASAFRQCSKLEEIEFPSTLSTLARTAYSSSTYNSCAFYGCYNLRKIVFKGPPLSSYGLTNLLNQSYNATIMYPKKYGAQWQKLIAQTKFSGFSASNVPNTNTVEIISTSIRSDDPSVLDVVYKVKSDKPTVKVRAVAYIDGVRSFSNIVRMENLVDGTKASVSDTVTANEEHTISWKASEDLNVDLAKVKVEVLAVETQLLPLEMIRIPAIGDKKAMELSWNVHTKDQLFDALLWLYADKTTGLTLTNGILYGDGKPLLEGADFYTTVTKQDPYYPEYSYEESIYHSDDAIGFIFKQMGYSVLTGDALTYANKMTRLGLAVPDTYYGEKNYAYRWIETK